MTDTISKERVIENAQNIYDMFVSNYGFRSSFALDMKTVLDSLRAALAQQAEQGLVRVPVEPTQEMINAGRTTPMPSDSEFDEDEDYRAVFIAMVAAAPKGGV